MLEFKFKEIEERNGDSIYRCEYDGFFFETRIPSHYKSHPERIEEILRYSIFNSVKIKIV